MYPDPVCIKYCLSAGSASRCHNRRNSNRSRGLGNLHRGQVAYQTYTGSSGSVAQGVQQPWEISTVTAIENTEGISLAISVYPNPTSGSLKLTIKDFDYKDLRYRIYDMTGLLLQDKEIVSEETEIIMNDFTSAMYFLKIANSKQEVKVFKIIKK